MPINPIFEPIIFRELCGGPSIFMASEPNPETPDVANIFIYYFNSSHPERTGIFADQARKEDVPCKLMDINETLFPAEQKAHYNRPERAIELNGSASLSHFQSLMVARISDGAIDLTQTTGERLDAREDVATHTRVLQFVTSGNNAAEQQAYAINMLSNVVARWNRRFVGHFDKPADSVANVAADLTPHVDVFFGKVYAQERSTATGAPSPAAAQTTPTPKAASVA